MLIRALRRVLPPPGPTGYYSVSDPQWAWPRVGMWADLLRIRYKWVITGCDEPCCGVIAGWGAFVERHGIVYRPAIWGTRTGRLATSPLTMPYP